MSLPVPFRSLISDDPDESENFDSIIFGLKTVTTTLTFFPSFRSLRSLLSFIFSASHRKRVFPVPLYPQKNTFCGAVSAMLWISCA